MKHKVARRIALVVEYVGTAYAGFQLQAGAPTIQAELERAIERLTGVCTRIKAAGRTDAGVHAVGQVVAFDTESKLATARFVRGLNHYLPDEIAVREAHEASPTFDPRRDARARVYRYLFAERTVRSPIRRRFTHAVGRRLDLESMREALIGIEGDRDFGPFSGAYPAQKSTRRMMYRTGIERIEGETGPEVRLEMEATAFLPQQVRRIAAALLQVGLGKLTIAAFQALADSGIRGAAKQVLAPNGLSLRAVRYATPLAGGETEMDEGSYAAATRNQAH